MYVRRRKSAEERGEGGRERVGVREREIEREREREREWEGWAETGRGGEVMLLTLGCGWWKGLRNIFIVLRGIHLKWAPE